MESEMINLTLIIPVFNDADALEIFLPELVDFVAMQNGENEIIIVDDGSHIKPFSVYEKICATLPQNLSMYLICLSRNFGKEAALSAGLNYAKGQLVGMMDSDGQHPVVTMQEMLALIQNESIDMVAAVQKNRPHENKGSRFLKKGFYQFMQDKNRYQIMPNAGDFRIMNRKVVDALLSLPEKQRFMKGLYAWVGFRTAYLPFEAPPRSNGTSKFQYRHLFELAIVGITSFSLKPLRWISRTGIVLSIFSICYGLFIAIETLILGRDVAGWATLATGIMLLSGLQLTCLGIIGEYIGRIYEEVKNRPLYLIDQIHSNDNNHR